MEHDRLDRRTFLESSALALAGAGLGSLSNESTLVRAASNNEQSYDGPWPDFRYLLPAGQHDKNGNPYIPGTPGHDEWTRQNKLLRQRLKRFQIERRKKMQGLPYAEWLDRGRWHSGES